jgi:hypothetical protein
VFKARASGKQPAGSGWRAQPQATNILKVARATFPLVPARKLQAGQRDARLVKPLLHVWLIVRQVRVDASRMIRAIGRRFASRACSARRYELPLDGGPARMVARDDPRSWSAPLWVQGRVAYSPDGTRAAGIVGGALVDGALTVAAIDGTDPQVLIPGSRDQILHSVLWSPAGDRIAYVEVRDFVASDPYSQPKTHILRIVDPETGQVATLATAPESNFLAPIVFSPDGARVLYSHSGEEDQALWIANTDGSGAHKIVDDADSGGWISLP